MARQSDGRYRAKVTVGKDMNGGSVIKYVSGRTKKELEAAKEAVKQEFISKGPASPKAYTSFIKMRPPIKGGY